MVNLVPSSSIILTYCTPDGASVIGPLQLIISVYHSPLVSILLAIKRTGIRFCFAIPNSSKCSLLTMHLS